MWRAWDRRVLGLERTNAQNARLNKLAAGSSLRNEMRGVARILNIDWLERGIDNVARLICRRSNECPRSPACRSS